MNQGQKVHMPRCAAQGREHLEFLLRLKDIMPLRTALLEQLETAVAKQGFELQVKSSNLDAASPDTHTLSARMCCSTTHAAVRDIGMVQACCCFAEADIANHFIVLTRTCCIVPCEMTSWVLDIMPDGSTEQLLP